MERETLKIQVKKITPMSLDGKRQWNKKYRYKVFPYVFKALKIRELTDGVPLNQLNSKKKICDLVFYYCGAGKFHVCMMTNKKNKGHRSFVTFVVVELVEESDAKYSIKEWKSSGKFNRRFVSFKRIVGWQEK